MVLSIDADDDAVRLVSLMRDSMVEVDDVGTTKLNHAYAYGGTPLAIRTINQTFDLDIEHYVSVDFMQLAQIIDALGGVSIDVQDYEIKETNKFILEYCKIVGIANCPIESAGLQELNGAQAMSYARIRKNGTGDDWGRVERQAIVLEAMFQKVQSASVVSLAALAPKLLPYVNNDDTMLRQLRITAAKLLGEENVLDTPRTMGGEDFSFISRKKPSVFFRLGVTNPDDPQDTSYPLHHDHFDVDERCFETGIAVFVNFVLDNQDGIVF